jgi:3-oxoadipate enol-lactonase
VVLLHGWTVTADLNWHPSYAALGRYFSVLALDHRGHGRGLRSLEPFTLEDCADDVAALARELGITRLIAAGYSMGGPVAQLVWHRHPELVAGLVLCATASRFSRQEPAERLFYSSLAGLSVAARLTPAPLLRPLATAFVRHRVEGLEGSEWAAQQLLTSDAAAVLQAGSALGGFDSRPWLDTVRVPTAVVVTSADRVVPPGSQRSLAARIPGATLHEVDGDHGVCVGAPERFVPVLVEACRSVATRGTQVTGTPVPR